MYSIYIWLRFGVCNIDCCSITVQVFFCFFIFLFDRDLGKLRDSGNRFRNEFDFFIIARKGSVEKLRDNLAMIFNFFLYFLSSDRFEFIVLYHKKYITKLLTLVVELLKLE